MVTESIPKNGSCVRTNWDLVKEEHVQHFLGLLSSSMSVLPVEVVTCSDPHCLSHRTTITLFLNSFLDCLSAAASTALPFVAPTRSRRLPGWNDNAKELKYKANFWHRVWLEAGSPTSGVLHGLKKKAKTHYKYEVRRLRRREYYIR